MTDKPTPTTKIDLEEAINEAMSINIQIAVHGYSKFRHEKLSMTLGKIATLIKYLEDKQ